MRRTRCAVKITKKYFVASLRIVPSNPGILNCWITRQRARRSIIRNASNSSENKVGAATRLSSLGAPYRTLVKSQHRRFHFSCGVRGNIT